MKKILPKKIFLFLSLCLFFTTESKTQNNTTALMPMVNSVITEKGKPFEMTEKVTLYYNSPELIFTAAQLQQCFSKRMAITPQTSKNPKAEIKLLVNNEQYHNEQYKLQINNKGITIIGGSKAAVMYGIMTLEQILMGDVCNTNKSRLSPITIEDEPRFSFRALMLDPARNFLPIEDVKFFIDQMIKFKFNTLQLHLTDDQGWRVAINKYPELTQKGGFYTQQELKNLVEYAADRNVEIIPEIDIPGHTASILSVFPDLACSHQQNQPISTEKTTDVMLCAANPKVYEIYHDVIGELSDIFPSKKMHLGGDESRIDLNWAKCNRCKALMEEYQFKKPSELMSVFFERIFQMTEKNNKQPILWCELDNNWLPAKDFLFPYPKNVLLITWRAGLTPLCIELTEKSGHSLIMAPGEYAYLDYPQLKGDLPEFDNWGMPVTTLEQTYTFDPGYQLPEAKQTHIDGVMGTLWGEAMKDINRVTYMAYPRALALSEAGWTQMEKRNWDSFTKRMYPNLLDLTKSGVSVRMPFEIVKKTKTEK